MQTYRARTGPIVLCSDLYRARGYPYYTRDSGPKLLKYRAKTPKIAHFGAILAYFRSI